MILFPVLQVLALLLWMRHERIARDAWVKAPERPWNLMAKLHEEAFDWHRREYLRKAASEEGQG